MRLGPLVICHWQLVIGNLLLVIGYWHWVIDHWIIESVQVSFSADPLPATTFSNGDKIMP